jgi:RNA polymerase sigma-70 factor (ECF subfamily)
VTAAARAVADAHRREWAAVLAATVRVTRDLDLAEECVQDAYAAALEAWPRTGVPDRPAAWLTTAARHNALDAVRRTGTLRAKLHLLVEPQAAPGEPDLPGDPVVADDRLRLVFLCCHPALAPEARVALTMRLACGVSTPDVAAAFLVPVPTMAARLTRAKKKIVAARIPFRMPPVAELPDRLDSALAAVHLQYSTGHTAPAGSALTRDDVAARAVELARLLHALMPDEREVRGLLALLLANHARRATRTAPDGRLLTLAEQDRSGWDRELIAEADALVVGALRGGPPGRFGLQAAIATLHACAAEYGATDWPQILALYDALLRVWPSPVVALNRAVALAEVDGPGAGLAEVAVLARDARLAGYRYLPAVEADLLRRSGRTAEAVAAYGRAVALAENEAERAFLVGRLAELDAG